MKRWMISIIFLLGCLFSLILTGCKEDTGDMESSAQQEDKIEIGFLFDTFNLERWIRDRDIFVSAAAELGAEVNIQNAIGDIGKQKEQFRYFINKNVDVIVVVQVSDERDDLRNEVALARDAGIPVVAYDRLILNADVDLYVSFDSEQVGRIMGAHALNHIKEGKILIINGPLSDYNCVMIEKGFADAMEETDTSRIEIVGIEHSENWKAEYGFEYTEKYLDDGVELAAVVCGNDGIAGETLDALAEYRLAGDVCVVGQDADLAACQRIVEGTQCLTVYKPIERLARKAAELAVTLAKGEVVSEDLSYIDDGTYDVPFYKLHPIAVSKNNMDEYITDQYHSADDIYLNVKDKR